MNITVAQKPSMSEVLKVSLAEAAKIVEEQKMDEGLAGYLAGYLDRIRQESSAEGR